MQSAMRMRSSTTVTRGVGQRQQLRHAARALARGTRQRASSQRAQAVVRSAEYTELQNVTVFKAGSGDPVELTTLWDPAPGNKVVVIGLTHFADLGSAELGQKLVRVLPTLEASGVTVIAVGLGSVTNAQEVSAMRAEGQEDRYARYIKFPLDKLHADPSGALYTALGWSPGFLPDVQVSPYLKLLPMLAGIGSPGTVQEVLRGYVGDQSAKPVFDSPTPFDILGTGYQRPFELATLRLFNMVGVLSKWGELSPPNTQLLTQQGGALAFDGEAVIFRHDDSGILKYVDIDALLRAVLQAEVVA